MGWYHVRYFPIHPFSWSPRLGSFRNSAGHTYLVVANYYDSSVKLNIESLVYQAPGAQFIKYQGIFTYGTFDVTSFEYKGHTYLTVVNFYSQKHSALYKWASKEDERYNDQGYYQLMHSSRHSLCEHKTVTFAKSSKKYSGFGIL